MEAATAKAFERGMTVLFAPGKGPRERLRGFISGYAYGLMKFPGLTRTSFLTLFLRENSDTILWPLHEGDAGEGRAGDRGGQGRAGRKRAAAVPRLWFSPVRSSRSWCPHTVRDAGGIDYADDAARNRYIETMLTRLVG